MAAGRIKGITIEIGGDTTKLTKALASVDNAISNTQRNLRDLDKALKLDPTNTNLLKDKQRELANEISSTEEKLKTEKEALAQMKNTEGFDANSQAARNLQVQIDLDTAALKQLKEEAKASASVVGTVFQEAGKKIAETGDKIKDVGDKVKNVGSTLTQKVTVPIATAFAGSVKAAIDWESAFTGVMKTVDETANTTYDDLKKSINEIAKTTASSQNEIAGTMEIAGQLGVSADEITDFTKAVVMLKDTTNLTLDEGASAIAKFANVTNMSLSDVDKFGSAIVDLGNNYATTEADILSMATRLAGAGAQIGLSQGEILGFATALSSVGIEAEMGGSAFSKAMIKMQVAAETGYDQVIDLQNKTGMSLRELELLSANNSKDFRELADSLGLTKDEMNATIKAGTNLQDFAKVAHMNTKEFVELYKNDAPAALQAFIQGLGDTEGHGESTIAMLQEMGFTEVRLRDTLTRLANSEDLVVDAVHRGNEAWGENSAMTAEAEKRYATMEAKISQLKARFTEMAVSIGEMLMPYVERLMDFIDQLIEKWNSLDPVQQEMILKIAAIAAAVGPVLIVIGSVISAIGTIVTAVGNVVSIIGNVITAISAISAPANIPMPIAVDIIALSLTNLLNTANSVNRTPTPVKPIFNWSHDSSDNITVALANVLTADANDNSFTAPFSEPVVPNILVDIATEVDNAIIPPKAIFILSVGIDTNFSTASVNTIMAIANATNPTAFLVMSPPKYFIAAEYPPIAIIKAAMPPIATNISVVSNPAKVLTALDNNNIAVANPIKPRVPLPKPPNLSMAMKAAVNSMNNPPIVPNTGSNLLLSI